jgi:hypothetical protein
MAFAPRHIFGALLASIILTAIPCIAQTLNSTSLIGPNRGLRTVSGVIHDALGRPVGGARVTLETPAGKAMLDAVTDDGGRFHFTEPRSGTYALSVRRTGFGPATAIIVLPRPVANPIAITLEARRPLSLPVRANLTRAQNGLSSSGTNKYTLTAHDIANLPAGEATPLNQVLLQMPGVALDQNKEIHIRGEHMGIQYEMNGVLLPLDMNTDPTFTQLLNSYFVQSVSLMDGVLPAQYGYRTSGVIDIHTKNGCEGGHNNLTIMGGQRDTAQANFQLGGCNSGLSYYLTGTFIQSNLGLSSAVPAPDPIHDAVTQGQGFAYLTYAAGPDTKLSLITGMTLAFNQFLNQPNLPPQYQLDHLDPAAYPSSRINSGLNQQDYYGVLALNGVVGRDWDYQLAYSSHYNTQSFYPDPIGDLIYQGVSSDVFTSDLSNTLQGDLTYHLGSGHTLRSGFYFGEYGVETDQTSQVFPTEACQPAINPISVTANLNKINLIYGIYFQDTWQITNRLSVNFGSR